MTDSQLIDRFIETHGVTKCPPMTLEGVRGNYHRPKSPMMCSEPLWENEVEDSLTLLARAKIGAALDALASHGGAWSSERCHAQAWILDNTIDFRRWCETAGLDPEVVRTRARQIMAVGSTRIAHAKPDISVNVTIAHLKRLKHPHVKR